MGGGAVEYLGIIEACTCATNGTVVVLLYAIAMAP